MTSPLLNKRECYEMEASPFAVALGQTVEELGRPLIWEPGQKPYHVMDASKLKVYCPLRYRLYVDRVENFGPIFREKFTIHPMSNASAAPQFLQAMPASYGGGTSSSSGPVATTKSESKSALETEIIPEESRDVGPNRPGTLSQIEPQPEAVSERSAADEPEEEFTITVACAGSAG